MKINSSYYDFRGCFDYSKPAKLARGLECRPSAFYVGSEVWDIRRSIESGFHILYSIILFLHSQDFSLAKWALSSLRWLTRECLTRSAYENSFHSSKARVALSCVTRTTYAI